jgi:hypothetical protein
MLSPIPSPSPSQKYSAPWSSSASGLGPAAPSAPRGWTTRSKLLDSGLDVHAALLAIAATSLLGAPAGPSQTQTAALGNVSAAISWTVSEEAGWCATFGSRSRARDSDWSTSQ